MTPRPIRELTEEDRVLWSKMAGSATPLKGRRTMMLADFVEIAPEPPPAKRKPAPAPAPAFAAPKAREKPPLDRPTHDKLKKGRVPIDGKVDLHGMRQEDAHALLLAFLRRGFAEGRRHVLVITGKGASFGSDGVLRRAAPQWLATPAFRPFVSGYSEAARNHGGTGALYIRIARNPALRPD